MINLLFSAFKTDRHLYFAYFSKYYAFNMILYQNIHFSHLFPFNVQLLHESVLNEESPHLISSKKDNSVLGRKCPLAKFKSFTFMQNIPGFVCRILSNISPYPHDVSF